LPEGELLVALGREQADVEVLLGEVHGVDCIAAVRRVTERLEATL